MEKVSNRIQEALSFQSKYCYTNSNVLINNFDIHNQQDLDKVERNITVLMLLKLQTSPIPSANKLLSVEYFTDLHKQVFEHIYPFAGKIRNENMIKGNTPFCRPEYIYNYLNMLLEKMFEDIKKIKTKEDVVNFLAYYYSEINIVHPFREGNGRITREFLRQVVEFLNKLLNFNLELDFSNVTETDKKNLMNGSIDSAMTGNLDLLKSFFISVLKEKEITKEHQI